MTDIQVVFTVSLGNIGRDFIASCARTALQLERMTSADLSVIFLSDRAIRRLNKRWLGHDFSTDVISFPLGDDGCPEGEIYISVERARAQSREYGVSVREEIARLVIHGVLHLCGHDDSTPSLRKGMQIRENRALKRVPNFAPSGV